VWGWITEYDHLPSNLLREIAHFFQIYKDLEDKPTRIGEWAGKEEAWEIIRAARERYANRREI
jgi:inorganic pyrophosphatase